MRGCVYKVIPLAYPRGLFEPTHALSKSPAWSDRAVAMYAWHCHRHEIQNLNECHLHRWCGWLQTHKDQPMTASMVVKLHQGCDHTYDAQQDRWKLEMIPEGSLEL